MMCAECGGTLSVRGKCARCYHRAWRAANPGRVAKQRAKDRVKWYAKNRDRHVAQVVANTRLRHFGVTPEQYEAMLTAQGHRCAGCGGHESEFTKALSVDHDHACCPTLDTCGRCVRGLLCGPCNTLLGRYEDDTERLLAHHEERFTTLANYLLASNERTR